MANVKATDLIDFTRASKGHALAKVSYGEEKVVNGDFATDSDWTKSGGSTISDGKGHIVSTGSFVSLIQNIGAVTGKIYYVTIDVTVNSGAGVYIGVGGGAVDSRRFDAPSTGSYAVAVIAGPVDSNVQITRRGATDTDVDNISVREVTFDQPNGTLQLFEHPEGIPRIEYDADGNLLGLLIEESRTNLITYSEDFSNAAWTKDGASVVASTTTAPDGFTTPYEIVENSGAATQHRIVDSISISSGVTYTASVYVKRGTGSRQFGILNVLGGSRVYFNLDTGTVATETLGSGKIEDVGGGWYRCSSTGVSTSTSTAFYLALCDGTTTGSETYDGDGLSSLVIYGAQLEAGAFPTSYIKSNSGSTTTRSADVASIPVSDFGYNQNEGTLFVEAKRFGTSSEFPRIAQLTDGTSSERISVSIYGAGNTAYANVYDGGVSQASLNEASSTGANTYAKLGFGFANNNFAFAVDGVVEETDASGSVPDNISEMLIGSRVSANQQLNGHIKSIKYIPKRLSNAKLQELTS